MPAGIPYFEAKRKYLSEKSSSHNANHRKIQHQLRLRQCHTNNSTSTHSNLMNGNQHDKPTHENDILMKCDTTYVI